jgi:DNA-binding SARP family transcriptional activator
MLLARRIACEGKPVEFRILGPLEIVDAGVPLELPAGQRRSLLIDLLLHAGEAVSVDQLVDDLWEGDAPATADKIVQLHISHLRRQLGSERIERTAAGYLFRLQHEELDARIAERLAAEAAVAAPKGQVGLVHQALALWRGRPLADAEYQEFARNEAGRLEELRLSLQERLFEARLQLGEHREIVADLEALVAERPLREHLRALLMLALYRSGRQADALAAYRQGRLRLHDELGLEPGPELQQLERRILEQDPALFAEQRPPPHRARKARVVAVAGVVGALLVGGAAWLLLRQQTAAVRAVANSAIEVDAGTGHFRRSLRLGLTPRALALHGNVLWAANFGDRTVTRLDLATGRSVTAGIPAVPTGIAVTDNAVWVGSSFSSQLFRVDPTSAQVVGTVSLPTPTDGLAASGRTAWVVNQEAGTLVRVNTQTGHAAVVLRRLGGPLGIQAEDGRLWIAASFARRLLHIDPSTLTTKPFPLPLAPQGLSIGCGAVWMTNPADNEVTRFDLKNHETQTIAVGQNPISVAANGTHAWVANDLSHTLQEIDCAQTHLVIRRTIQFGSNAAATPKLSPTAIAVNSRGAWVALQHF